MNAFNTVFALLAGWDPALTTAPADAAGIALAFSTWMKAKHFWELITRLRRATFFTSFHFSLFFFFFPILYQDSLFRHLVNEWRKVFDFCFEGKPGVTNIP